MANRFLPTAVSLNRTFMELKFEKNEEGAPAKNCLNRTFMELKFGIVLDELACPFVLIEPLWN